MQKTRSTCGMLLDFITTPVPNVSGERHLVRVLVDLVGGPVDAFERGARHDIRTPLRLRMHGQRREHSAARMLADFPCMFGTGQAAHGCVAWSLLQAHTNTPHTSNSSGMRLAKRWMLRPGLMFLPPTLTAASTMKAWPSCTPTAPCSFGMGSRRTDSRQASAPLEYRSRPRSSDCLIANI